MNASIPAQPVAWYVGQLPQDELQAKTQEDLFSKIREAGLQLTVVSVRIAPRLELTLNKSRPDVVFMEDSLVDKKGLGIRTLRELGRVNIHPVIVPVCETSDIFNQVSESARKMGFRVSEQLGVNPAKTISDEPATFQRFVSEVRNTFQWRRKESR